MPLTPTLPSSFLAERGRKFLVVVSMRPVVKAVGVAASRDFPESLENRFCSITLRACPGNAQATAPGFVISGRTGWRSVAKAVTAPTSRGQYGCSNNYEPANTSTAAETP